MDCCGYLCGWVVGSDTASARMLFGNGVAGGVGFDALCGTVGRESAKATVDERNGSSESLCYQIDPLVVRRHSGHGIPRDCSMLQAMSET